MRRTFIKFYVILLSCFLAVSILFGVVYKRAIDEVSENYLGDLLATVLNLIGTELHDTPPEQWKEALQNRHLDTTFNLDIQPVAAYEFDASSTRALDRGDIIALSDENVYVQKIQDSNYLLIAGPVSYAFFLEQLEWVDYAMFIAIALSLAIPVYFWMRPHWRDLSQLENAANKVSQGDLSTQVHLHAGSAVQPIGRAFNDMTHSIQSLIERQDTLIQDIAHEVRTPLARLRYRLALLETADAENLDMQTDIEDIDQLIAELLFRARVDSAAPNLQEFGAFQWLQSAVDKASVGASAQISWHIGCQPNNAVILAEHVLISRALDNLLNNAKRYANKTIQVTFRQTTDSNILTIEDDGAGIPEEKRAAIFEPFVRLDNSRTRSTGGYGLGLAIVASVVKAHHGQAHAIESQLGGAGFVLQWPTKIESPT